MRHLKNTATLIPAAAMLCLAFPQAAFAATEQGHSLTLPQLLLLGLVMGWYLYNHFKDKIKALFKKEKDR